MTRTNIASMFSSGSSVMLHTTPYRRFSVHPHCAESSQFSDRHSAMHLKAYQLCQASKPSENKSVRGRLHGFKHARPCVLFLSMCVCVCGWVGVCAVTMVAAAALCCYGD